MSSMQKTRKKCEKVTIFVCGIYLWESVLNTYSAAENASSKLCARLVGLSSS